MKNSQLYLILKLKSFNPYYLNRFVYNASKKFCAFFPVFEQQVFLPKLVERFTVLRSPHVDKKARDQMERCVHQRIMCWALPYFGTEKNFSVLFLRLFRVFAALAVGVEFRVEYVTTIKDSNFSQKSMKMKKRKI